MPKKGKRKAPERSYARLARHERNTIELMLDRGASCRSIAAELGRAPSTVSNEVAAHRFVVAPRARAGEPAPEGLGDACERLRRWPRCCNGCRRRKGYGCGRSPRVAYVARLAQEAADRELVESRRGVDEGEAGFAMKVGTIRSCMARGLSPAQIAALHPELGLSASTIYRWVDAGYGDMTNMELRRKVGYKPRKRAAEARGARHSARRSHGEFMRLPEGERAAAWEMDTVEGRAGDSARLLTLLHRPSRFQLALPMADGTCDEAKRCLGLVSGALGGADGMRRVVGRVLTDNGPEFADEAGIAALLGERDGETRLFYCDPMRSDQKGACEKNHVEIRKLLPKGRGVSFDRLTRADLAPVMSQVNSEPRGELAFMSPARMLLAAFGDGARALMDAFGIEELGRGELDLTPGCVERARAERGDAPLAG